MKSFSEIFEKSKNEASNLDLENDVFPSFRDQPGPYRFLTAIKDQYWNKDEEALSISYDQDRNLTDLYLKKQKPIVGYSSVEKYIPLDSVDSRHIMMSSIIFSHLGRSVNNIVEIGAGFGNWIRLNEEIINFKSWTMVDMGFVSRLQKWYVDQTVSKKDLAKFVIADNDKELKKWFESIDSIDLVIGTHSLSELSLETFNLYYEKILPKTKYLFYATHKHQPSKSLVSTKLDLLSEKFNIVKQIENQEGKCINILYEIKK